MQGPATTLRPLALDEPAVVKLHRRQYVLGPAPYEGGEDWVSRSVGDGIHLSCCPELRNFSQLDRDGRQWTLLGLAVDGRFDHPSPGESIAGSPTSAIASQSEHWSGRWLLVGPETIVSDASGLLGCLFGADAQGTIWVSGSPAILAERLDLAKRGHVGRSLYFEQGISWFPPPSTRYREIRRLLPSQALDPRTGQVGPRDFLPRIDSNRSTEAILHELEQTLTTIVRRVADLPSPIWLGLTSGYDSRVTLSLAAAAGVSLETFTRASPRMSLADRLLPPRLARACGFPHHYEYAPDAAPEGRLELIEAQTGRHVSTGDAEHIRRGVRDAMTGIMLGGHGWALANGWAGMHALSDESKNSEESAATVSDFLLEPKSSPARAELREWFDWVDQTPQPGLHWQDRFFLEQRQTGWLGAKEQLHDVARLERMPIMNTLRVHSLLLSVNRNARLHRTLQLELIRRTQPELLEFPFNPGDWRYIHRRPLHALQRNASRLQRRLRSSWRHHGAR